MKEKILYNVKSQIIILACFMLLIIIGNQTWKKLPISGDVSGYYLYLPAIYIYNDVKSVSFLRDKDFKKKYKENVYKEEIESHIARPLPSGNYVFKYSIGMSILATPFFLLAHTLSILLEHEPLGYTSLYQLSILISAIFYTCIGLYYVYQVLIMRFSKIVSSIVIFTVLLCSNLLFYSTIKGGYTHCYSFTLFAILFYHTIKWSDTSKLKHIIWIGISMGLIAIVRPVNLVVGLIPLLYNICDIKSLKAKINFYSKNFTQIIIAILVFLIVISPQLFYWKYVTGSWFFFSYGNERFYFNDPEIIQGLFGFRKGWIVYSPMMLTCLLGFFFIKKYFKEAFLSILLFFVVNVYIVFSWWSWWYGGGFGMRALIEMSAILTPCMASFIAYFYEKIFFKVLFSVTFLLTFVLNLFQSYQYQKGILPSAGATFETYKMIFGRYKLSEEEQKKVNELSSFNTMSRYDNGEF
jgi:hypothetical protein